MISELEYREHPSVILIRATTIFGLQNPSLCSNLDLSLHTSHYLASCIRSRSDSGCFRRQRAVAEWRRQRSHTKSEMQDLPCSEQLFLGVQFASRFPRAPPSSFRQPFWLKLFARCARLSLLANSVAMPTDIELLEQRRRSAKAETERLARVLKNARARGCYEVRREEEGAATRRRIGLAILASRPEGAAVLKSFVEAELFGRAGGAHRFRI